MRAGDARAERLGRERFRLRLAALHEVVVQLVQVRHHRQTVRTRRCHHVVRREHTTDPELLRLRERVLVVLADRLRLQIRHVAAKSTPDGT